MNDDEYMFVPKLLFGIDDILILLLKLIEEREETSFLYRTGFIITFSIDGLSSVY